METQPNRYLGWFKYHWKQLGIGGALITSLTLISGINDVKQFLDSFFGSGPFDSAKISCALHTSKIMTNTAPIFKAKLDRDSYKVGQTLTIELLPESNAYFSLIDHGSDPNDPKRAEVLFKNEYVQKNNVFILPKPNTGFLEVFGPVGINTFEIISSVAPIHNPKGNSKSRNVAASSSSATGNPEQIQQSNNCTLRFKITS